MGKRKRATSSRIISTGGFYLGRQMNVVLQIWRIKSDCLVNFPNCSLKLLVHSFPGARGSVRGVS